MAQALSAQDASDSISRPQPDPDAALLQSLQDGFTSTETQTTPTNFLQVPPDVWLESFPRPDDPRDHYSLLKNLCLTCRAAYENFSPILYERLYLLMLAKDWPGVQRSLLLLRSLLINPCLAGHVRDLWLNIDTGGVEVEAQAAIEDDRDTDQVNLVTKLVDSAFPHMTRLIWNQAEQIPWVTDTGKQYAQQSFRVSILSRIALTSFPFLKNLTITGQVNKSMIPLVSSNLRDLQLGTTELPPPNTLAQIMQRERLTDLQLAIPEFYPLEALKSCLKRRKLKLRYLNLCLIGGGIGQSQEQIAAEILRKCSAIDYLMVEPYSSLYEPQRVFDCLPKVLESFMFNVQPCVNLPRIGMQNWTTQRFSQLEYLDIQPEVFLGFDKCKHAHATEEPCPPSMHPKTLISDLNLPNLSALWFEVDGGHCFRNGDDYFVVMLQELVYSRALMPKLEKIGFYQNQYTRFICKSCHDWLHPHGDCKGFLFDHEMTRIVKLATLRNLKIRNLDLTLCMCASCHQPRGFTLHRVVKINARRSWRNEYDDDFGLFEMFET